MNKKVLLKRKKKFCDGMKDNGKEDDDYEILTFFSNCRVKLSFDVLLFYFPFSSKFLKNFNPPYMCV